MDVSLFLQNVAMSSVASASVIPLRMLTLAQLAGRRSATSDTTPFTYEVLGVAELLRRQQTDRQPGWGLHAAIHELSASSFLSSKRLSKPTSAT